MDSPVKNDSSIARRCWATSIQVVQNFVLRGWSELNDGNSTDVAVTADVISLIEADNSSRVVDDSVNLVSAEVVEDVPRLTVE